MAYPSSMTDRSPSLRRLCLALFSTMASWALAQEPVPTVAAPNGEAIYQQLCVECHGKQGEGVAKKCDDPLRGERNLQALAKYITKNMPEDKPYTTPARRLATHSIGTITATYCTPKTGVRSRNIASPIDATS